MKPPPKTPFTESLIRVPRKQGPSRWRNEGATRYYEWDGLHGELEVYNRHGKHLGAVDPASGVFIKDPVKGRSIDV